MELQPFRIAVPDAALADLHRRLDRVRWPDPGPAVGFAPGGGANGIPLAAMRTIVDHWRHRYDWRRVEARLNGYEQWLAAGGPGDGDAAGVVMHVLHAPSPRPDATPLVLTHGWPGSVVEMLDVIEPLRDPDANGAPGAPAFHVIVPSLPGYGFSGPTTRPGVDTSAAAAAIVRIVGALGYEQFVAQGGDWGAIVTRRLGEAHTADDTARPAGAGDTAAPASAGGTAGEAVCAAIHLNMCFAMPGPDDVAAMGGDPMLVVSDHDKARFARAVERVAEGTGYMAIQGTKPDALTPGHVDSPAGLAAWILEKFHAWSDLDAVVDGAGAHDVVAELATAYDLDRLLDNVTLYWLTATAGSAARLYAESARAGTSAVSPWSGRVEVPTGHAVYPGELLQTPRAWAERRYHVVHWAEQPRGGHFAAMERPALFVDDLRAFAHSLPKPLAGRAKTSSTIGTKNSSGSVS